MKLIRYVLLSSLLFAGLAEAQQVKNDLAGLGMPPEQANYIDSKIGHVGTLAAAGSSITDAGQISALNNVTRVTAADGTKGVKLPLLNAVRKGVLYTVINSDVTSALKVYSAATGETITGQAGNTAISLAAKLQLRCIKYDTTSWFCEKGVTPY